MPDAITNFDVMNAKLRIFLLYIFFLAPSLPLLCRAAEPVKILTGETRSGRNELLEKYEYYEAADKKKVYHGERLLFNPIIKGRAFIVQKFEHGTLIGSWTQDADGQLFPLDGKHALPPRTGPQLR